MQKNEREEEDSGLPGVCHRLFNWLLSRLVGFSWRLASSSSSSAHMHDPQLPDQAASTEVPVEYTNGSGGDHGDHKTVVAEKDDKPISNGKSTNTSVDDLKVIVEGGRGKVMRNTAGKGKVRLPIEEGGGGGGGNIKKEERRPWPRLISLVTNINEISDDYIRKRKEAMQRTSTMPKSTKP